jgi:hypothetical protein
MSMNLPSGFEIAKFSDLKYDGMAVEIRYKGVPVAELNMDKGKDCCEIEIPSRFSPPDGQFTFPLKDFVDALSRAEAFLVSLS